MMSSAQVDRPTKVGHHHVNKKESEKSRKTFTQQSSSHNKKHNKPDEGRHFKFGRKRTQSFSGNGKFFAPYKRRKKDGVIIPPTKFLLGGNICDPLNLNSMQDEEVNRAMNAVTPKSSPLPTPRHRKEVIEVIIPPNLCDPLNLNNPMADMEEYEKQLISPTKRGLKKRHRKRKRASSGSGKEDVIEPQTTVPSTTASATITTSTPAIIITTTTPTENVAVASSSSTITATTETITTPIITSSSSSTTAAAAVESTTTVNTNLIEQKTSKDTIDIDEKISAKEEKIIKQEQDNNNSTTDVVQIVDLQLPETSVSSKEQKIDSPQKDKNKLRLKGLDDIKDKRLRKVDIKDKIVSPVIPQPGAWKRLPHRSNQDKKKKGTPPLPNFRKKDERYQYGNYDKYYGYRNLHLEIDPRLTVFSQRKELFYGKDVLDIGCNIGHITLSVARDLAAHSVTGIDIDRKLIGIARANIKHYVNCVRSPASNQDNDDNNKRECDTSFFPMSMPINYGPIDVPGFTKNKDHKGFPYNVTFVQGNYILEDDSLLTSEQPQFDTILCLSITKWLHLNFGDAGLKQAFKRMHAQLRPGGVLVLESQRYDSYKKKKRLTERIYRNFQNIQFFPDKFTQYLLSSEVGFTKCEVVSIPCHPSKGFQRPVHLFTKAGTSPERAVTSLRYIARQAEKRAYELRVFERDLFPHEVIKFGNLSSQRSIESVGHYERLENVYAPSTTPCYDTPSHNNDSQSFEPDKSCHVYADTKQNDTTIKLNEEPENLRLKELRKRITCESPISTNDDNTTNEDNKTQQNHETKKEQNEDNNDIQEASSSSFVEHEKTNENQEQSTSTSDEIISNNNSVSTSKTSATDNT
ncbi:7SK snRNA methylphosphate capping enzyme-like [Aphidius gifuensis]|nr:7SK snRNA methylphosphate capping enzyme-like [Aphidius gifuensis]